jgi:hypothetical protein
MYIPTWKTASPHSVYHTPTGKPALSLLCVHPYLEASPLLNCAYIPIPGRQPSLYSVYIPILKAALSSLYLYPCLEASPLSTLYRSLPGSQPSLHSVYIPTWKPALSSLCVHPYLETSPFHTLCTSLPGSSPLLTMNKSLTGSQPSPHSVYIPTWKKPLSSL